MTTLDARPETARGRATYRMLLGVHAAIRRDLEQVEQLAEETLDGKSAEDLQGELGEIRRNGALWRLQVDCLRYCHFVHSHHNAEDGAFFPELRETNPEIGPVIDRLQADHRRVSDQLDEIDAAAKALAGDDREATRRTVVNALRALREDLLTHLDYEERSLEATILRVGEHGRES